MEFSTNVPETDEDVATILQSDYSENTGRALLGIYRCRRARGEDVLVAWEYTLLKHVEICGQAERP